MSEPIDRELVIRCIQGEQAASDAFVRRFTPYLAKVIRTFLSGRVNASEIPQLTDEILQDALLTFWKNDREVLRKYDGRSPPGTYLGVVAVHRAHHILSARKKTPGGLDPSLASLIEAESISPLDRLDEREQADRIREALDTLPPREKLAFLWVRRDGMSYEQAGKLLGIEANSVGPLLSRARERLLRTLPDFE